VLWLSVRMLPWHSHSLRVQELVDLVLGVRETSATRTLPVVHRGWAHQRLCCAVEVLRGCGSDVVNDLVPASAPDAGTARPGQ
jgi:hypothetical protein